MRKAVQRKQPKTNGTKTHQETAVDQDLKSIWWERQVPESALFYATDEAGRTGWFIRFEMPGLYPRRLGPFDSKEAGLCFMGNAIMQMFSECINEIDSPGVCIVEGIPMLKAVVLKAA